MAANPSKVANVFDAFVSEAVIWVAAVAVHSICELLVKVER